VPRTKEQFEAMQDAAREKILDAALTLFSAKGLAATGVTQIAREAKVSLGLLYHYFATKEELFDYLVKLAIGEAHKALKPVAAESIQASEAIRSISQMVCRVLNGNNKTALYFLMLIQAALAGLSPAPSITSPLTGAGGPFELLECLIRRGQADGSVRTGNPRQLAQLYWAAFQGLCLYKVTMRGFFPPEPGQLDNLLLLKEQ
jgi:AcrR family transcriptional regulator